MSKTRTLLLDYEENGTLRAVLVGTLRERLGDQIIFGRFQTASPSRPLAAPNRQRPQLASFFAAVVMLLGLLAALRPLAFRMSARSAGISLAIVGAASLALSDYASALLAPWGVIALVRGIVFVVVAEWEAGRRAST